MTTSWYAWKVASTPNQVLNVRVEASPADILAAMQRSMAALRTSGAATEQLAIYYRGAYEIIGDAALRMLYDTASLLGSPDCSKLFTDIESRLTVKSFYSEGIYNQLTKVWEA